MLRRVGELPAYTLGDLPAGRKIAFRETGAQAADPCSNDTRRSVIEDVERRLRARLAVAEGLQMAHYLPERADEIGYFYVPWHPLASTVVESVRTLETNRMKDEEPRLAEDEESGLPIKKEIQPARRCRRDPDTPRLLIPYEWCELSSFAAEKRPVEHVLVLWLKDDVFFDAPLARLADLFSCYFDPAAVA